MLLVIYASCGVEPYENLRDKFKDLNYLTPDFTIR